MFINQDASPATLTTKASGCAICTPIEAGKPYPIVPNPPDVIHWFGFSKPKYCAAHIWCWPTSVQIKRSLRCLVSSSKRASACCGLIVLPFCSNFRQFTFCQSSISAHHFCRPLAFTLRPRDFQILSISSKTWPTSPMMGISTWITLLIEDGSISICAFFDFGLNASRRPVIRSSKRAPMLIIRSQSCMAKFAS